MPNFIEYFEIAKVLATSAGVVSASTFVFQESAKTVITESIKKLFERKPKAKQALESAKASTTSSEEEKVKELADKLQTLAAEDQDLKKELENWFKKVQKVNQDAKEGRNIKADNYFENVHSITIDQRKS